MEEQKKQAQRIQTSILSNAERKALNWLSAHQPRWVTSNLLTAIGTLGALMVGVGLALTRLDFRWMWLSIAGLAVNWYGDSLDGSLARYRKTQRPTYGYYLDHTIDAVCEIIMAVGFGLSPYVRMDVALAVVILYLCLTLNVSINAHLKSEFKLTYAKLGPTEFRLILTLGFLVLIFLPGVREFACTVTLLGQDVVLHCIDLFGIFATVVLTVIYIVTVLGDLSGYAKVDPPKRF